MQSNQPNPAAYDQYKKIFCAYHKTEFLTNFCVHKNCLMPLCPSCIVDHTDEHYKQSSKPLYMNLHDALYDAKENCLGNIHIFEDFTDKLKEMSQFKKRLIQEVHNQLMEHKQNIFTYIDKLFMQFQHQVYELVVNDYDKQGLYREDDINEYELKVQDTINELYNKIAVLKGDQCLAGLIMFYGQDRELITQIRQQCEGFIKKHESSNIDTTLDENSMKNQLANLFENLVDIKRVAGAPLRRYEPIQSKTPQRMKLNNSSFGNSRKSKIFNQSDSKYLSPARANLQASNKRDKNAHKYDSAYR